ncbi:hypothetical protein GL213_12820 [Halogeometricum borinquense]|uniref:Uncharacterized protein n=1 Tax=Halogeometricum borinquense TaxID=60847 RepID=A0A6C0UFE2_9EURY|nr:hypothetical protein [Halogeometricum borinquense]QIB73273.1 hypothetical protein G3I44_02620 [Halogeometricum borinquense]QIQ77332.1 hypothetical protein GL213_12820 [Halogeometricum borinquense]
MTTERGQANLIGLAAALVLLATVTTGSVALASVALADADTDSETRHAAETLADRLVAADADHTRRANAVSENAIRALNATAVDRLAPSVRNRTVRIRLGDDVLVERGDPEKTTVRRLVRVEQYERRTTTVDLVTQRSVSLPDRTETVELDISTDGTTTLTTVRANDRIVLRDRSGLSGTYEFKVARVNPPQLEFTTEDGVDGTVTVTWTETTATVEPLEVTVGA